MPSVPIAKLTPNEKRLQERLRKRKSRAEAEARKAPDIMSKLRALQKVINAKAELVQAKAAAQDRVELESNEILLRLRDVPADTLYSIAPTETTATETGSVHANPLLAVCQMESGEWGEWCSGSEESELHTFSRLQSPRGFPSKKRDSLEASTGEDHGNRFLASDDGPAQKRLRTLSL
jgi:hypothetical protein